LYLWTCGFNFLTAGQLQGLTVMQHCVNQMTFNNGDEFKK